MNRYIFCSFLMGIALVVSCIDKNEEVDEDSKPSWLGESIYTELSNADQSRLTGTFKTYLRLIDDLDYTEVLNRTGSKTVFPANDEAFERFFSGNNSFGVTCYEELSEAQKKMLLYYSMLDNAILTGMLSNVNVSDGSSLTKGMAIKHPTTLSVYDSLQTLTKPSESYPNNPEFKGYDSKGIDVVTDGTTPMMVHFTREYMLNNGMTTTGDGSDFSIVTGEPFDGSSTYIFRNKVINADVTCQNGYIHQLEDVLDPPGNMAQVLRNTEETSLFSRMLDRYAKPSYSSSVTQNYNDWAEQNNIPYRPDSIFEVRYLSENSHGETFNASVSEYNDYLLPFDPGWNEYYIASAHSSYDKITDIAAMFVPDDDAIIDYFINGTGSTILQEYGTPATTGVPVSKDNITENLDLIPQSIVTPILTTLMKESFASNVPSLFETVTDDVGDFMGLNLGYLKTNEDGSYDIKIANNGVIYVLKDMIAPTSYQAVSAPARFKNSLSMMGYAITNSSSSVFSLNLDYYAYLQTMTSNFAFFLPTNDAFGFGYIDPATYASQPSVIKYVRDETTSAGFKASRWLYDIETGTVGDSIGQLATGVDAEASAMRAQLADVLNYCTVVLNSDDNPFSTFGVNNFYKTKNGGAIKVTDIVSSNVTTGAKVLGGYQIDGSAPPSNIFAISEAKNGMSYQIDNLIQGPMQSVYSVLSNNSCFSEFLEFCQGFENTDLLEWVGISSLADAETGIVEMDQYRVFYGADNKCLDNNVKFFSAFNYTVYAPNNDAMQTAYKKNLPKWGEESDASTILGLYAKWLNWHETFDDSNDFSDEEKAEYEQEEASDKAYILEKIKIMKQFARYHFQKTSVFVDNYINTGEYSTFLADTLGISQKITISGSDCKMIVKDLAGVEHEIRASSTGDSYNGNVVNCMTRDFTFDANRTRATYITATSYAVVHELSEAFYYNSDKDYSTGFIAIDTFGKKHK